MRRIATLGLVLAVAAAGAAGAGGAAKPQRLKAFKSCGELLAYAKRHGARTVGPWGFGGPATTTSLPAAGAPGSERAGAPASSTDFSGTNVQEAGVDEPDIVKTDGRRILAVVDTKLRYVDVSGERPRLRDSLDLPDSYGHQLLVEGDRALVVSTTGGAVPLPEARSGIMPVAEKTVLREVDLGNPGALRVVRTLTVDGAFLSARLTGSTARLVLRTLPRIEIPPPGPNPGASEERNRQAVAKSTLQSWLPRYTVRARGKTTSRSLANCRSVRRPAKFSGLGLVTVLTLDLSKSIEPVDSDALMTSGEIVYASTDSLYVATQTWVDPEAIREDRKPPRVETAIHSFTANSAPRTAYRGSGRVPGYLLNQWSLSEHRGALRVASTTLPLWWPGEEGQSESLVTVLEERGGDLVRAGQVGGLGRGERVFGVRFIGDTGYVVTFRQVDPLYTIDLSNHERPAVRGELKILGYSAYLHPVGEDLLLGVGQDATGEGRVLGTQVSLFDVSDLRKPERLDRLTLAGASSEAEFDHHAFLYWPRTRLAVLPLQTHTVSSSGGQQGFVGAVGVRVSRAGGVAQAGRVTHEGGAWIRRSLVAGGTLYTVSEAGVRASALDTLADRAWLAFPK